MNYKTLIQLRDEDFADCLRAVAKNYDKTSSPVTPEIIIAEALASQPQRYYLSFKTVSANLSRLRNSGTLASKSKANRSATLEQWRDINKAVSRYMARNKHVSLSEAITYVVNFSRPSRFFISDKKAYELFRRTLRREYRIVG